MEQAKIRVCAATHTLESVWEKYVGTYFGLKIDIKDDHYP